LAVTSLSNSIPTPFTTSNKPSPSFHFEQLSLSVYHSHKKPKPILSSTVTSNNLIDCYYPGPQQSATTVGQQSNLPEHSATKVHNIWLCDVDDYQRMLRCRFSHLEQEDAIQRPALPIALASYVTEK